MPKSYKIHPAIGIARLGNSQQGWFLGPESPGEAPRLNDPEFSQPANGKFKAAPGEIKRQGARFRVYEYDDEGTQPKVREITDEQAEITWSVQLSNHKAAGPKFHAKGDRNPGIPLQRLLIDADTRAIQGRSLGPIRCQGSFQGKFNRAVVVPLGDLRTDALGRLIVLGGFGNSFSPAGTDLNQPGSDTFNHDDWCDDTSDGRITAKLRIRDTNEIIENVQSARVIVGPPDFAPVIGNVISLYDIVYEAAFVKFKTEYDPLLASEKVLFTQHVYPLLERAAHVYWVEDLNRAFGHDPEGLGNFLEPTLLAKLASNKKAASSGEFKARNAVLARLRSPTGPNGPKQNMPMLRREIDTLREPTVTTVQYRIMEAWAKGGFTPDGMTFIPVPLASIPPEQQPFALDKAALDACVGAAFYPGIEAPRILRDNHAIYSAPFRIADKVTPGTITQGLALPWQTDFVACGIGWWPAQHPNSVMRKGTRAWQEGVSDMVKEWAKLGYVIPAQGIPPFVEDERDF